MSFDLLPYAEVKALTKEDFDAAFYKIGMDFGYPDTIIVPPVFYAHMSAMVLGAPKEMPAPIKECEHLWKPDYVGNNPTVCENCKKEL